MVDPTDNCLLDKSSLEVVGVSEEQSKSRKDVIDTVTQQSKNASDDQLLESGKKVLDSKLAHLSEGWKQEVIDLFVEFKDV